MKEKILNQIAAIESEKDVEVLFAVESGSRAWGFESIDSDYDIRFVYRHRAEWYLNLWEQKDTIEFMTVDDLDGAGWDIRKTLKLIAKTNASFNAWLFSPIVYRAQKDIFSDIKKLAIENFSPIAGFYHFYNMNKNFVAEFDKQSVNLKKFFYATRTALCAHWTYQKEMIPPVPFQGLYELISTASQAKLDALIKIKKTAKENFTYEIDSDLIAEVKGIIAENERIKDSLPAKTPNREGLNEYFIKMMKK